MGRKLFITFSLMFSALVILLGGYNCARQQVPWGPNSNPYDPHNPNPRDPYDPEYPRDPLPEEPENDRCNRKELRTAAEALGDASAYIRLRGGSSLEDFLIGQRLNFPVRCARMVLNMERVGNTKLYRGDVYILYDVGSSRPDGVRFNSGHSKEDNTHNRWSGSFRAGRRGVTGAEFSGIFQHTGREMALILQIDRVVEEDVADGETDLRGYGNIWFKTFRHPTYFSQADHNRDPCYQNGPYMRHARKKPPRPSKKCWFLTQGPYNCRPNGIGTGVINISKSPTCYNKLGTFGNLEINEAFNVERDEDHP